MAVDNRLDKRHAFKTIIHLRYRGPRQAERLLRLTAMQGCGEAAVEVAERLDIAFRMARRRAGTRLRERIQIRAPALNDLRHPF